MLSRRRTRIPDGVIGARTTRSAAHDWKDDALAALRALTVVELALGAGSVVGVAAGAVIGGATRGDVGGIPLGHETRAFSDDAIGARTTRSAALGRSSDVLAARRSLAVVVSAQESRRGGWQSSRTVTVRGDVGEFRGVTKPARFPTTRSAHVDS